jgi:glycosyltransferase involved in cell wall biosynthesis
MNDSPIASDTLEPISIVMTVHDQAEELQRNLPTLLALRYQPGVEIIIVDESSSDDTTTLLQQFKNELEASVNNENDVPRPTLYTTYIPASSHYLSRKKLAITVGVKAAHNEWVILTDANCHPENEIWLEAMAQHMKADVDIVCGYTSMEDAPLNYVYHRLLTWWRQGKRPYRYSGGNLAIRKSAFMNRNGFSKDLQYLRGEYDFLVNETEPSRIAVADSSECRMLQETPSKKTWLTEQINYMFNRQHMRRTFWPHIKFVLLHCFILISYIMSIAVIVYGLVLNNKAAIAIAALYLLLIAVWRTIFVYLLAKKHNEKLPYWKALWVDLGVIWHNIYYWLRYKTSNKQDFARK